jgi:hypothetical protein
MTTALSTVPPIRYSRDFLADATGLEAIGVAAAGVAAVGDAELPGLAAVPPEGARPAAAESATWFR